MSEKDLKPVTPMTRHSKENLPAPMTRSGKFTREQSDLLDSITPEAALTEEQKQPLSKREKPQPAEAVFPRPVPSASVAPSAHVRFSASSRAASAEPMKRHTITAEDRLAFPANYTSYSEVTPSPKKKRKDDGEKPDDKKSDENRGQQVSAAVVKVPLDKKPLILSAIAIFLALVIILGCVFGITKPSGSGPNGIQIDPPAVTPDPIIYTDKPVSTDLAILGDPDPSFGSNDAPVYEYTGNSIVGFTSKVERTLDSSEIVKPTAEPTNENLPAYPTYGSTLNSVVGNDPDGTKKAARSALIREAGYLASANTANGGGSKHPYNMMTAEGKLQYLNNGTITDSLDDDGNERYLYKHTASVGMYGGNVEDSEPRIVKTVTMRVRGYNGYGVTGLYAPAGEVIKIEIDDKDMTATGGLTIHIGQALYNGQANNIWADKGQMQRFPMILNTMLINKNTATFNEATGKWTGYVGSFLGGPLYIRNANAKFTATISGCVRYSHFILGHTTEAEFMENAKSSAPYFDLEVWDKGVLHSGPKSYVSNRTYDDLYKVAVLWEKVASVTTYKSNQGIVFIYDPFVAAGAAVAFPGRRSVNCPAGWMRDALNYNGIVTSGSWGNFHEYHHNFQGYGVGNGGEVTNNALTLVSYALFTKISAKRGITSYGAQGLGGWNNYTSATWALEEVLKIARPNENPSNGNQGLALYATLLHNFGADAFMNAKVAGGGQSYSAYMNAWQNVTHTNMYYYFNEILKGTGISDNADSSYPMFVPVSCVYQTGRSYMYDGEKKYFKTMRPFVIPAQTPFEIDLNKYSAPDGQYKGGSIVIPDGFTYKIKSATSPQNGKIEVVDSYKLKYTPDANNKNMTSGPIVVTLEIEKNDGAFEVDDVDLILEFEQSFETNKMTLERTTYSYSADKMYQDAETAYNNQFAGYTGKNEYDHSNPTQNCNTDIWYYPDNEETHEKYPNAPESHFVHDNTIEVIEGKLYFQEAGKYRVYLRGRTNCAVYYSKGNDKNFVLGAAIKTLYKDSAKFHPNDENTYFDVTVTEKDVSEGGIWLYFKEVLIVQSAPAISFIGLGMSQWTQTMFTVAERHYNASGSEVDSTALLEYQYTETTYNDGNGNAVAVVKNDKDAGMSYYIIQNGKRVPSTEQEVSDKTESKLIPPTSASYVNAYRSNYQFPDNSAFESDYFYVRSYNFDYLGEPEIVSDGKTPTPLQGVSNYVPWNTDGSHDISHLFDGDLNSIIFFARNWGVSAKNPAILAFDMGEVITANSMTLFADNVTGGNGIKGFPGRLSLEGSLDGESWFDMGVWSTSSQPNESYEYFFNDYKAFDFRYFKLTITGTCSATDSAGHVHSGNNRIALSEMKFSHTMRLNGNGANHVAPDNSRLVYGGSWQNVYSLADYEGIQSNFGYAYLGKSGSTVKFEMIGTRLAVLTCNGEGLTNDYEVYIDGKLAPSIKVKQDDGGYAVSYISQKLNSGKHKVEIRCKGTVCLDSLAIYNEE